MKFLFKFNLSKCLKIVQILSLISLFYFFYIYSQCYSNDNNNLFLEYNGNISVYPQKPCFSLLKNLGAVQPDIISKNPLKVMEIKKWALHVIAGEWSPLFCVTHQKVAIIIPYRDRQEHLLTLLNHLHPFLQRQLLFYGIFVIEQAPGEIFNKGALYNVGFQEALSRNFTCFIFHDVDMLPIDLSNFYECHNHPMHLSVAVDKFHYSLPYVDLLGGVVAMTGEQFIDINGFSNLYFGWGSEDDDLSARVRAVGYKILRNSPSMSRFIMIQHSIDKGNPRNKNMDKLFSFAKKRYKQEGLNSLKYTFVSDISDSKLYRKVTVQFSQKEIISKWKLLYNLTDDAQP